MSAYDISAYAVSFLSLSRDNETCFAFPTAPELLPIASSTHQALSLHVHAIILGVLLPLIVIAPAYYISSSLHHLHAFDGPRMVSFSRWWSFRRLTGGKQHLEFRDASDRFGERSSPLDTHQKDLLMG